MRWVAVASLALMIGIVGRMDYDDAKAQEQHYTNMVCSGAWPDYDNRNPECK